MTYRIVSLDIHNSNDVNNRLYYGFIKKSTPTKFSSFSEFIKYKKEESRFELKWEFLIIGGEVPIGLLTIKNNYKKPEPIFFLVGNIKREFLTTALKDLIKNWLIGQQNMLGFQRIIVNESKGYLVDFFIELGGKVVNWLHFFELDVASISERLINRTNDENVLKIHGLHLEYHARIPEHLLAKHASLHTKLSNDIKRKDYSWSVIKDANYTRNRQGLVFLQGQHITIAYLMDKEDGIVGMSKMIYNPQVPDRISQTITGVSAGYRGMGLAKVLKRNMIWRVMEAYPKVRYIDTDCLLGNDAMLLINKKLGFRRKRNYVEKEIIIDELI